MSSLFFSCNTIYNEDRLAIVSIGQISDVGQNSASCAGTVVSDNGLTVTERGVCWSENPLPTIENNTTIDGSGTGDFVSLIENLLPGRTYYLRAYATNEGGTSYSEVLQLTTQKDSSIADQIFNENLTYGTITDVDGNNYRTIQIGDQVWMAENLRVTKYRNGDPIPNVEDNEAWTALKSGAQAAYNNNSETNSINKFGRFYNYYAVADARNLAPVGWHIPTTDEWTKLENYLASTLLSTDTNAKSIASTSDWTESSVDGSIGYINQSTYTLLNNSSGFSALPSGICSYCGCFAYVKTYTAWWNSDQFDTEEALFRSLNYNSPIVGRGHYEKKFGLSVRCVKD